MHTTTRTIRFLVSFMLVLGGQAVGSPTYAQNLADDEVLLDCVTTPSIVEGSFYPGEENITNNNNLRRITGIALVAKGEPVYITGRVVDEDCLPVFDAAVEMWHTNTYGNYQAGPEQGEGLDENFLGAGKAYTNNLGRFHFITIFPGATGDNAAPKIHFKVKHKNFDTLETVMFFPEQASNEVDEILQKYKDDLTPIVATNKIDVKDGKYKIETPDADSVYEYNITLRGKNKFKHY